MKTQTILFLTLLISLVIPASCTYHETLKLSNPESVGMSSDRLLYIDNLLQNIVDNKTAKGAVAAVARHGKLVYMKAAGETFSGYVRKPNWLLQLL
jgi:uncharacterized lipoprotein YajG